MTTGKNFNLFLMDGTVTGRIKCTLANWTGLAYKIPRTHLSQSKERADLKQSGVYFLFGKNEADEDEVYIGQAGLRKNGEGVLLRVTEHLKDEAYFSEAILLTTQNNSFGPTEISYLEHRFTNLAIATARYRVRNANDPNPGNVTEEKESELEDFISYAKMVLGVLGYKVFVPLVERDAPASAPAPATAEAAAEMTLYLSRKSRKAGRVIEAQCRRTSEGFVVLAGSMIDTVDGDTIPKSIKALREKCIARGDIAGDKLMRDTLCTSPTYAAAFVLGMTTNGRTDWKTADGTTFKAWDEAEAADSADRG